MPSGFEKQSTKYLNDNVLQELFESRNKIHFNELTEYNNVEGLINKVFLMLLKRRPSHNEINYHKNLLLTKKLTRTGFIKAVSQSPEAKNCKIHVRVVGLRWRYYLRKLYQFPVVAKLGHKFIR